MLGAALICLVVFLALTAIVVLDLFASPDRAVRAFVHDARHPLLGPVMEGASFLGGPPGQVAVILLATGALWRRSRRWALGLPAVMMGAGLLQLVAKWTLDRPRPNEDPWGFPSAHVLSLVVLFGYLAYVLATSRAGSRWRRVGLACCIAPVAIVAWSRMYLEAHWLSDVLGGLSSGGAYLLAAIWVIGIVSGPLVTSGVSPTTDEVGSDPSDDAALAIR
jgi:membrane-associated phospholipid phosphatase